MVNLRLEGNHTSTFWIEEHSVVLQSRSVGQAVKSKLTSAETVLPIGAGTTVQKNYARYFAGGSPLCLLVDNTISVDSMEVSDAIPD